MLRNHGLPTVGPSVADAFLYLFKTTCQIQLAAQSGGGEFVQVDEGIVDGVAESARRQTEGLGGAFVWPALLRKLDRVDPPYRS